MNYLSRKYFPEKSTGRCFSHFNRGITVCFAKKALPSFSRLSRSCFYCGEGDRFVLPEERLCLTKCQNKQFLTEDLRSFLVCLMNNCHTKMTLTRYFSNNTQNLGPRGLFQYFSNTGKHISYCRNNISSICRKTAVGRCSVKTGALRRNSCGLMNFPHQLPHYY